MKSVKYLAVLLSLLIVSAILLTACGEKASDATKDESAPGETTVVLETTDNGGTIELDSESNKITKDSKGNVISVEDKDGNPINVEEYIETHSWIINTGSSGGSGISGSSGSSGGSGLSDGSGSSSGSGLSDGSGSSGGSASSGGSGSSGSSGSSSDIDEDQVEEDIPVIIATLPDDEDMVELPDL